jgi:NAD(P)-dependent dehydrogenase (short-subunit alcohol dehydrogenase family)
MAGASLIFVGAGAVFTTGHFRLWCHERGGGVLTRYLAKELGPRRITVNVVAPGAIQTDFSGGMVRDNPEINKRVAEMTALGRAGVPDDIGPMIAALLSDENRWVNGQRIEVSGGMAL